MVLARVFFLTLLLLVGANAQAANLEVRDLKPGAGAAAVTGAEVTVHYTGWLMDGTRFDSSHDRGKPFAITLGERRVIPGWEIGLEGMKAGGKRELIIPPQLAYGKRGTGGVIPPHATLRFEIDLLTVVLPRYTDINTTDLAVLLARGVRIVDIRRPEEWRKTGVIEGSELLTFVDRKGKLNPGFGSRFLPLVGAEEEVILICRTGNRTRTMSKMLADQTGYSKVYNVTHGITRWIREGRPVVKARMPDPCWLC